MTFLVTRPTGLRRRLAASDPIIAVSALVCLLLVLAALAAPLLAPYAPDQTDILSSNLGPSSAHLLGTDSLGRDIFSRVLYGARLSLLAPFLVIVIATTLGTALALSSAWIGGRYDTFVSRVLDVLFAFPSLLLAILAVAVLGTGIVAPVLALAIVYTPYLARIARTVALQECAKPYIDACYLAGFSSWRITLRHILPATVPIIRAQATIGFASALMDLGAISFIGLGVQPPTPEWGAMINEGRSPLLDGYPMEALSAGLLIVLTVVAFNLLGERLARRAEERS
jgi:peptide/nickel transport system permease protein